MRRAAPALLLLAACAAAPPPAPPAPPGADTCGLAAILPLVGQPATALERVLHLGPIRIIRPGDAVTEDFSEQRLNVRLDGADRIASADCG